MLYPIKRIWSFAAGTLLVCSLFTASAFAAENRTAASVPVSNATSQTIKKNAVPVYVDLQGTDSIGSKLAYQMREKFNSSSQFTLTDKDQPKIIIILGTTPEFAERPAIGSAYSVIWLYYANPKSYNSYLTHEVGVVSPENIEGLVDTLVERTTGVSAKYSYLFE